MEAVEEKVEVTLDELVKLCAVNTGLFNRTFFPRAFRQASPDVHRQMLELLENPAYRYVCEMCARDMAKTTLLRAYTAKRIAYGVSRTILYIGPNESHAARSINWIRGYVERDGLFKQAFGLRPGKKWQDGECQIYRQAEDDVVWLKAGGIEGNTRGLNFDDYRPDLIILDDCITDENAATDEQRRKISELILGALKESLAPASEAPNAKMVMLQTPLDLEDASMRATRDPQWKCAVFGCWTPETADLPVEQQVSAWPERYPTEVLRAEKLAAIQRNELHIFMREKEVKLISPATSDFRPRWIQYVSDENPIPDRGMTVLAIDPVPPPTEHRLAKNLHNNSFEAIAVLRRYKSDYFLLDYSLKRGHDPSWTMAEVFRLAREHNVARIVVETVAYQSMLKYLLEQEMKRQGRYYAVIAAANRTNKHQRIIGALKGALQQGHFWCRPTHSDFVEQITQYPKTPHPDLLDAISTAVMDLRNDIVDLDEDDYHEVNATLGRLPNTNHAP